MERKHKIIFFTAGFVLLFLLAAIFFDEKGVLDLVKLEKRASKIELKNEKLKEDNRRISEINKRLLNDQKYVEGIARKDLGMIAKDELIFKFRESKKENTKDKEKNKKDE